MPEKLLSLRNVCKQYPGVLAMNDVSIDVYKGETLALIGENGAGKSTLIKTLSGAITPTSGTIQFEDGIYEFMDPQTSTELGISVIYQEFNLMDVLSVAENLYAGRLKTDKFGLYDKKATEAAAKEVFKEMEISVDVTQKVEELSTAYMQIVEIAKSLAKDTKLLIMDEPTAPLTSAETEILFKIMAKLKEKGITIIFISHRLDEIFAVADRVTVMRDGQIISTHDVKDMTKAQLIKEMIGRDISNTYPKKTNEIGEVVLDVQNLKGNGIKGLNLQLHKGEILGLAGLVGAGRTEIMRVLFGADPREDGKVFLHGKEVYFKSPKEAVKHGVVLLPEDRKRQGVILPISIAQNVMLPNLKKTSKFGWILDKKKEEEVVQKQIDDLQVACYGPLQRVGTLSGGNQQKIVLAKWLASENADVFIFDEPTRGIDVGAKWEIYLLMNKLCEEGKSIIMISSEMEEIIGMSDRIVVLHEGTQTGEIEKKDFSQQRILTLASGE